MTETIRMHAVVPVEKPKNFWRPRTVPIATASSRKISGAVALIHLMRSILAFPRPIPRSDLTAEITEDN